VATTTALLQGNQPEHITRAANLLRQGQLVAVPTETVYGLAADASQPEAVRAIFAAKGRPTDHPLIVHLPNAQALPEWAQVPAAAWRLAEAFWPGPLTLLLPKQPQVSDEVTGGLPTVGLRVSAHPVLQAVLQQANMAVAAPSANLYRKLSPTTAAQALAGLEGRIAAVLDGGPCEYGLESTIVDLTRPQVQVVRAGPITAEDLAVVLGQPVAQPQQHSVKVSGNVSAHYQPNTPVWLMPWSAAQATAPHSVALLSTQPAPDGMPQHWRMPTEAAAYAQALYRTLAEADQAGVDVIVVEPPPQGPAWRAVHDRLQRAASVKA
jgi:L-threonylcarbamoyladenylate synthase